ncbi:hypothetical protein GCM10020000_43610 [Streptomyces olivoverticillatus]
MDALVAAAADLVGDQVRGHDLAEVAQVDRAGGAEAGCDDDGFAGGAALTFGDDLVGETGDPVGLGALSLSHGTSFLTVLA